MAKLIVWQNGISRVIKFIAPAKLDEILIRNEIHISHPCGNRGTCGKCRLTLAGCVSEPNSMEQLAGVRLSCQAVLLGDAEVWLAEERALEQIEISAAEKQYSKEIMTPMVGRIGAAVDIGTTTLAMKLFDLRTGECIGQSSRENPQRSVSADVMGRIQAALEGEGERLQQQILTALETMLTEASTKANINPEQVDVMLIVGNTTMLYLLTGKSPVSLAYAPFKADDLYGRIDKVIGRRAYLPHCMNAYVGADITAAVLASGMCEKDEISLLCDIGTNGELALWKDETLYVSSTAAGPAFEGAGISCGCGSIMGAVDKVWVEEGSIRIHTIGEAVPVGICGSGLLDAIAAYLELGEIDETGAMDDGELLLSKKVAVQPKDVRAVQLAKAAIAAGIETMFSEARITASDVRTLYIAGGFGSHINIESAIKIGLIPAELKDKVEVLGNAALTGAVEMLLDQRLQITARKIAGRSKHVNLGGNKVFNEQFVEEMMFSKKEERNC